jgi:UDPglucose 6-dehydrogenase
MTVTFVGHGYVGLVSAAVFADLGNTVHVIGHTKEKIDNLKKGIIPIYEPGLDELVKRNLDAGRLIFTLEYTEAIPASDVIFIAVGTPPLPSGDADLSVVFDVAKKIGKYLKKYSVVITKSTVPVRTSEKVREIIQKEKSSEVDFDYASVPEFLREGQAISDTFFPDRVVIGTDSKHAEEVLSVLHKPIVENGTKDTDLVLTTIPTAEMIKYASNAFLATKISFANAIAQLSEQVGADGPSVLHAIGLDKRIGASFLYAGAGYGGSCFPKDVKALIKIADQNGYDFALLKDVEAINEEAMNGIVKKAQKLLGDNPAGKKVGILGLSFKPDTDDMRDAPSRIIINKLHSLGIKMNVFDPIAMDNAKGIFKDVPLTYSSDAYEALQGTDLLIMVTEWNEFKELDLSRVKSMMKTPQIIDGRNIYDPIKAKKLGFSYIGVGR